MPDKHVTRDQRDRFLSACSKSRYPERNTALSVLMMAPHSLRVSEVCSLKSWDINTEYGQIYINGVPRLLCQQGIRAVENWRPKRDQMNLPRPVNTLFVSERRKPLSRLAIHFMVRQIAEAAGLGYLSIHPEDLRHWSLE
jgi:site-specific recombinase XerD